MTQGQGGTPAGWYPDPDGSGERWWDGARWGQARGTAPAQQPPYPPQNYDQAQGYPQAAQSHPDQGYRQPAQQVPQQEQQPTHPDMRCVHCGWNDFQPADYQLINPRGTQPFNPDNFNFTANCLTCRRCGFIHWFAGR